MQFGQPADFMQRICEVNVFCIELTQAVEVMGIKLGEVGRELLQKAAHSASPSCLKAVSARSRLIGRSMIGGG